MLVIYVIGLDVFLVWCWVEIGDCWLLFVSGDGVDYVVVVVMGDYVMFFYLVVNVLFLVVFFEVMVRKMMGRID